MNKREEKYFLALSKDRQEIADVLERRSVKGYKDSVIDKYSDQAHFIYELLQNADDVCATRVKFILEDNRLVFIHNGSRHFSVSDPKNEDADSDNKTLGDINAITSIANSNKTGASIGKFGVGFKAVFQYTETPHIYDPDFKFRIERFIVPVMLQDDFPERKRGETVFVFPFNHPERMAKEAYSDISDKLQNLSFPLLFLTNLKEIIFELSGVTGAYKKTVSETFEFEETKAEHVSLLLNIGDKRQKDELWLFSRKDEFVRRYSVGFFVDKKGHLRPLKVPAFCFFPTKEVTGLNFILHAPFLLTDSREGIRAGVAHNDKMINLLAELAADALEYLKNIGIESGKRIIDDTIVNVIPIDTGNFSDPKDKSRVSFLPFYETIKGKLKTAELIPARDGFVESKNAYWAAESHLSELFSNDQLSVIADNKDAKWTFVSISRDEIQRNNRALFNYIDELVRTNIDEKTILTGRETCYRYTDDFTTKIKIDGVNGITADFIEKQEFAWLHTFYKWLSETKYRTELVLDKPILLDQNGKAAAVFDEKKRLSIFLPIKDAEGYTFVHEELLNNKTTLNFIRSIGVKEPSLKVLIYDTILPQYKTMGHCDTKSHFVHFFNYYCKCSKAECEELINRLKSCDFLIWEGGETVSYRGKADALYMPTEDLIQYFSASRKGKFIAIELYKALVGEEHEKDLFSFLADLGVNTLPRVYHENYTGKNYETEQWQIDGLHDIIWSIHHGYIDNLKKTDLSVFLWNILCVMVQEGKITSDQFTKFVKERPDARYKFQTSYRDSEMKADLLGRPWLVNVEGTFKSAGEIKRKELSVIYDLKRKGAAELLDLLEITDSQEPENVKAEDIKTEDIEDTSALTETQRQKIEFANKLKAAGIENEEDLEEFLEFRKQKEAKKRAEQMLQNRMTDSAQVDDSFDEELEDVFSDEIPETDIPVRIKRNKTRKNVIRDIAKRTMTGNDSPEPDCEDFDDADEYMPSAVDYQKTIDRAKQKSAAEIDKIAHLEELQTRAFSARKYSYEWFTALLEMEAINSGATNSRSREVSISFSKVEKEPGTKRTLVLKHPSQYIPQFMEDLADIPLVLHMGDQSKTVAIEVASIKSYTLRVKLKNAAAVDDIDLSAVTSATINAQSPTFLLEELRKQFAVFEYDNDFNMQENLCENIEFVFGPPGTGKTTHLAKNVILPIMKNSRECKVLVLTPTNKAADVLTKRITEVAGSDTSYKEWLIRFGATADEDLEQSTIFRDKTFDIRKMAKNVTVTTIARFPYDFFMPEGARVFLNGINWDYIIIDEASMIPLANIVYPLYKKTPKKFIIAGDPFQIEPITSVDFWKNENIYTMVKLNSFANPKTVPHPYKIELLTTQYRSVPDIGDVFSKFTYGGILQHYRSADSQRPLNVGNDLDIKTLNIIKFPVSKYESIYRCKRLQHSSSYQVYSALFTFEYVNYLAHAIAVNNPGKMFRIGIIAPYRAQADMIDKLLAAEKLPNGVDVQVGTIHGFQGDECDIIFAVFNTPPTISDSKEMFLNKKNIINVSISRAKDYLFIVMPDDNTENIENLRLVKRVEKLVHEADAWKEFSSPDLEALMFDDSQYLENNTFSTSHQSVNVYGLPEKKYEIRTEETAVDVQVHKEFGQKRK